MKHIHTFESFINEGSEFKVTLPYEGDAEEAAKEYGLKIKSSSQDRIDKARGVSKVTFTGSKQNLLKLLDEFGGEKNAINTMDEPYGRIMSVDEKIFLNEANVDPKEEAQEVIEFWEKGGFQSNDLKQDKFLDKAIKDYEIGMGVKIHRDTKKEIKIELSK